MTLHATIPVLLYHSIAADAPEEHRGWVTRPEVFVEHMDYLHDQGYQALTVTEYAALLSEPEFEASDKTVVITFDDGFADFVDHALPVLTRHSLCATLYVVTGCIGSTSSWLEGVGEGDRPMMGWDDLEALAPAGIEVGAHTHSHPQLDIINRSTAWDEISRSRAELEDRLGREIVSFAYPFGFHGPRVRALVERAGFRSACAVKDALSRPGDDPLAIARVIVPGDTTVASLAELLEGRGRPVAWRGERTSTRAFRVARRSVARARSLRPGQARAPMGGRSNAEGTPPRRPTYGQ
jgi:peptidoglycan/xylan/chitin deacetylase (PgdA/CDA1 family)